MSYSYNTDLLINVSLGNQMITDIKPVSSRTLTRYRRDLGIILIQREGIYYYLENDLQILRRFVNLLKDGKEYYQAIIEVLE